MKSLSVIVPTYNEESCIERVLCNVLDQTYDQDVEVLIADGGSRLGN